ncbi:hypothetical protein TSUD_211000 [Trifolium subterraneum]|uniref:TF-B3 domain-containing protein n=1 Tax=Trifolium subterraneum TaxID=3900 RepID=A0A2Z6P826_TRISU|nr:hypothetical protein TSUD_211000 [Trifolium subterraneum]
MCCGRRFIENSGNFMFKDVKGGFVTVTQNFMEDELGGIWRLKDECGNRHIVKFNNSSKSDFFVIDGMIQLRQFYGLTGSHLLLFGYKGNKKFRLTVFKKEVEEYSFPAFHSQSRKPKTQKFVVTLTKYTASKSELLLKKDFAEFMRGCKQHKSLYFMGPSSSFVPCKLLNWEGRRSSVKFGSGWKKFCADSGFKAGDVLTFECKDAKKSRIIFVTKTSK